MVLIIQKSANNMSLVITMMSLTYLGEIWNELTFTAMIGQIWAFPMLVALVSLNLATIPNWTLYAILVLLLCYPNGESLVVSGHRLCKQASANTSKPIRSRLPGILEMPTPCVPGPCQQPVIICLSRPVALSVRTFIVTVCSTHVKDQDGKQTDVRNPK